MIRNAHPSDGDGLLKVKPTDVVTNPISSWSSESFTHLQVSSSISFMSQCLESWGSTAGNKHIYKVMGKKCLMALGTAESRSWEDVKFGMLFKATMLVIMSARLARRGLSAGPPGAPMAHMATHRCWSGTRWGGQTRERKGCCPSCRCRSGGISAVGLVMASVCLLDLFAKYLQQAGAHFIVKKTDRNTPQQEALEVNPKHSEWSGTRAQKGCNGQQTPDWMEVRHAPEGQQKLAAHWNDSVLDLRVAIKRREKTDVAHKVDQFSWLHSIQEKNVFSAG